jgi:hypothetical protein
MKEINKIRKQLRQESRIWLFWNGRADHRYAAITDEDPG